MCKMEENMLCCPHFSYVQLFAILWTLAHQAPLSMGFSRQEYWSGLLFPSPGDLPDPGIEPWSPALQADCLLTKLQGKSSHLYFTSRALIFSSSGKWHLSPKETVKWPGFILALNHPIQMNFIQGMAYLPFVLRCGSVWLKFGDHMVTAPWSPALTLFSPVSSHL